GRCPLDREPVRAGRAAVRADPAPCIPSADPPYFGRGGSRERSPDTTPPIVPGGRFSERRPGLSGFIETGRRSRLDRQCSGRLAAIGSVTGLPRAEGRDRMVGTFRERLRAGEALIGTMVTLPLPAIAEILADLGFDWLFVDGEHGPLEAREILAILQA